jgi:hypothetical protein
MPAEPLNLDPRLLELLHRGADGSVDPAQAAELDARLAAEPALRAELEALKGLVKDLDGLPAVEVPAGLKEDILQELHRRRGAPARPARSRAFLRLGVPAWAAALLLAAGGAAFWQARHLPGMDPGATASAGAMGALEPRAWPKVLEAGPASGGARLVVRSFQDHAAVTLEGEDLGQGGPWHLAWQPGVLECTGLEPRGGDLAGVNRSGAAEFQGPALVVFRERPGNHQPKVVVLSRSGQEYLRVTLPAK